MHTLRTAVLALALLAVSALTASGQNPSPGQVGTRMWFDHDVAAAGDTEVYQLCVDGVSDATCQNLAVLTSPPIAGVIYFSFVLPPGIPRGVRSFQVRAVGYLDTGASEGSNVVTLRIVGKPPVVTSLRLQQAVTP